MLDLKRDDKPVSVMASDGRFGQESLSDLLGNLINTGIVLQADVTLTLANVDLVYIGLKAVVCAVDAEPAQAALGQHTVRPRVHI